MSESAKSKCALADMILKSLIELNGKRLEIDDNEDYVEVELALLDYITNKQGIYIESDDIHCDELGDGYYMCEVLILGLECLIHMSVEPTGEVEIQQIHISGDNIVIDYERCEEELC